MREAQRLLDQYTQAVRFPRSSGFEVLELLDVRSRLAAQEQRLDPDQRARLEEADSFFLRHADAFYESVASLGELSILRSRAAAPCSHWWWYLEKLAQRALVKA